MWKKLHDLSESDRHAELSWLSLGVWAYVVPHTDCLGRFSGDPRVIKAKCMTFRETVRLDQVEEALVELDKAGLLHLYTQDGKRYLVLHQHAKYNPTGNLKNQAPRYPDPVGVGCECTAVNTAVNTAVSPLISPSVSGSSSEEGMQGEKPEPIEKPPMLASEHDGIRQMLQLCETQMIPTGEASNRKWLTAMAAKSSWDRVHEILMMPGSVGTPIHKIYDTHFDRRNGHEVPFKPTQHPRGDPACPRCKGSGKGDYAPGTGEYGKCGCLKRKASSV